MYDSEYGNSIEGDSSVVSIIQGFAEVFIFDVIFFPFNRFSAEFDITLDFDGIFFPSNKFIAILNTGRGR